MTALRPPPYTLFSLSMTTPSDFRTPRPNFSSASTEYVAISLPPVMGLLGPVLQISEMGSRTGEGPSEQVRRRLRCGYDVRDKGLVIFPQILVIFSQYRRRRK